MADALQNYIDGKWVDALDGERFDIYNPATGEVIATAPGSKRGDVDRAVAAARRTFDDGRGGRARRARERGRILCAPPTSSDANATGSPPWSRWTPASRSRNPGRHEGGRLHVRVLRRLGHEDPRRDPARRRRGR